MKIIQIQVVQGEQNHAQSLSGRGAIVTSIYALDDEGNIWLKQQGGFHPANKGWEKIDTPEE